MPDSTGVPLVGQTYRIDGIDWYVTDVDDPDAVLYDTETGEERYYDFRSRTWLDGREGPSHFASLSTAVKSPATAMGDDHVRIQAPAPAPSRRSTGGGSRQHADGVLGSHRAAVDSNMPALLGDDLPPGWRAASLPSMLDDRRLGADGWTQDDAAGDRAQSLDPEARVFRAHLASNLDRFVGNWLDSTMPRRIAHVEDSLRMSGLDLPARDTLRMVEKDVAHHGGRGQVFRRWAVQQGADAESVERAWMLLAPRTAVTPSEGFAAVKPRVIYRGLLVEALDSDEVDEHIASFQSMSDAQVRAEVERALDADGHGGLTAGLHWSSSPTVAINFATGRDVTGYRTDYGDDATVLGLVLKAEIDPAYVIADVDSDEYADAMDDRMAFGEDGGEEEVMPREGVPLRLTEAEFMVDGGDYDMLTVAYVRLDEHMQVTAMADRSGVPEVDQLIEEFLEVAVDEYGANDVLVKHLRDPENSHGMCDAITDQFVEFAKKRGFTAYVTHTDLDEMGYKPSIEPFGEIGFDENDEMQYGFYPEHTVATIVLKDPEYGPYGREIVVDFTASQYGYTDHPKVSKVVSGVSKAGRWWSAREGATAHFMTNDRRTACGRLIDPLIEEPSPMSRCGRCSNVMAGGWSKQYEPSRWEQGNHPNGADQRRRWQAHVLNTGVMTSEATRGADGRATEGM